MDGTTTEIIRKCKWQGEEKLKSIKCKHPKLDQYVSLNFCLNFCRYREEI